MKPVWDVSMSLLLVRMTQPVPYLPFPPMNPIGLSQFGTWSLLGREVDQPILTEEARVAGFTNEGGIQGKIRFLQNITGLWILQRLMAEWKEQGKEISYDCAIAEATVSDIRCD